MTAHSVMSPLQAAAYAKLTGDAAFMALVRAVCDDVPEGQAFPYVSFGEWLELPWDCFGQNGSDVTFDFHIWSRFRGFSEAQAINNALVGLLDGAVLTITGYTPVVLDFVSTQQLRDPDGITRHLVTQFRLLADAT